MRKMKSLIKKSGGWSKIANGKKDTPYAIEDHDESSSIYRLPYEAAIKKYGKDTIDKLFTKRGKNYDFSYFVDAMNWKVKKFYEYQQMHGLHDGDLPACFLKSLIMNFIFTFSQASASGYIADIKPFIIQICEDYDSKIWSSPIGSYFISDIIKYTSYTDFRYTPEGMQGWKKFINKINWFNVQSIAKDEELYTDWLDFHQDCEEEINYFCKI